MILSRKTETYVKKNQVENQKLKSIISNMEMCWIGLTTNWERQKKRVVKLKNRSVSIFKSEEQEKQEKNFNEMIVVTYGTISSSVTYMQLDSQKKKRDRQWGGKRYLKK